MLAKTKWALQSQDADIQSLVFTGGVASNTFLRDSLHKFASENALLFSVPEFEYCTDNAAMIGAAALSQARNSAVSTSDLEPRSRWPID